MIDIEWILTEPIRARQDPTNRDCLMVVSLDNIKHCYLSWKPAKELSTSLAEDDAQVLLFNGEFIETESFMGFVGLFDSVDDSPHGDVLWPSEFEMIEL